MHAKNQSWPSTSKYRKRSRNLTAIRATRRVPADGSRTVSGTHTTRDKDRVQNGFAEIARKRLARQWRTTCGRSVREAGAGMERTACIRVS